MACRIRRRDCRPPAARAAGDGTVDGPAL